MSLTGFGSSLECPRVSGSCRAGLPSGPFQEALLVQNVLSLRLASGPFRSFLVCRGRVGPAGPRSYFIMRCFSRTVGVSDWLRAFVEVSERVFNLLGFESITVCFVGNLFESPIGFGPLSVYPRSRLSGFGPVSEDF